MGLKRFTDARESYEKALALDEDNEQIKAVCVVFFCFPSPALLY
jgi:hypothetical protein